MEKTKKNRTKVCKNRKILFSLLSAIIWVGVAVFSIVIAFSKFKGSGGESALKNYVEIKDSLIGLGITLIIGLCLSIFMSNKLRTTIYMVSVIIASLAYGSVAMYIEFGLWFIDEYIFKSLADYYKAAYRTNKEIDLREE